MANNLPSTGLWAGPYMTQADAVAEIARIVECVQQPLPNRAQLTYAAKECRAAVIDLEIVALARCNGVIQPSGELGFTEENEEQAESMERNAVEKFKTALFALIEPIRQKNIDIEFQGDPRGAPVTVNAMSIPRVATFW